jgi:hypothetical protein
MPWRDMTSGGVSVGFAVGVGVDGAYVGCAERCWRAVGWQRKPDKEDEQPEDAAAGDTRLSGSPLGVLQRRIHRVQS